MVATRHPQSLGQHSEVDTVDLLSIDDGVHGSVNVKQKTVFPTVPSQGSVGRESAGDVVMHDDGHAKMLGGLCSVQHALARAGRGIQVVTFDLARLGLGFVERFGHEQESISTIGLILSLCVVRDPDAGEGRRVEATEVFMASSGSAGPRLNASDGLEATVSSIPDPWSG